MGVFATLSALVMPHILKSLSQAHPELQVTHVEGNLRDVESALRSGDVDIALTYDAFLPNDLEVTRLFHVPPHAILAESDPLAQSQSVTVHDLAERPLILLDMPDSAQYIIGLITRAGYQPQVRFRTTSTELIRSTVAMGLGVSVAHVRPASDEVYSGDRIVCRPLLTENDGRLAQIAVVNRKGYPLGARAMAFLEHSKRFANSPAVEKLVVV